MGRFEQWCYAIARCLVWSSSNAIAHPGRLGKSVYAQYLCCLGKHTSGEWFYCSIVQQERTHRQGVQCSLLVQHDSQRKPIYTIMVSCPINSRLLRRPRTHRVGTLPFPWFPFIWFGHSTESLSLRTPDGTRNKYLRHHRHVSVRLYRRYACVARMCPLGHSGTERFVCLLRTDDELVLFSLAALVGY